MSLEKAIEYGKEHREEYRGRKAKSKRCRNHGNCPYCENGRLHKNKRREPVRVDE
jgi:hypothetical protein